MVVEQTPTDPLPSSRSSGTSFSLFTNEDIDPESNMPDKAPQEILNDSPSIEIVSVQQESESSLIQTRKHPLFWYPDGNVIVQIENTQFKLHRSWLVKRSGFFATVMGSTNYVGDQARVEQVDEDTICYISSTTADDFATLLTAIDEAMYGFLSSFQVSRILKNLP
jgi:hypothetical protein